MKRRNKILLGVAFVVVALAAVIALTTERGPSKEQKAAQARLLVERKTHLDQMKKQVDNLIGSGIVESAASPTDFYVDVRVGPRFYGLSADQKRAVIGPIYLYYLTLRDKTESDIFAVRLLDARTGKEVGAYQAGELQMSE
jgi:hypothetical protein